MCHCSCSCALKKYVLNGRGIGLKVVILVSLLVSLIASILTPLLFISVLEKAGLDSVIADLPVVTIKDGKITDPVFNNETFIIPANPNSKEKDARVVINTIVDKVPSIPADVSIYIAARNIYLNNINNNSRSRPIHIPSDLNIVLTHEVVKSYIEKFIWGVCIVIFGVLSLLASILLFSILYIPVRIIGWILNKNLTTDAWGRAFAWPWAIMWCLTVLNIVFNIIIIPFQFVVVIPLLVTWIIGASLYNSTKEETQETVMETTPSPDIAQPELTAVEMPTSVPTEMPSAKSPKTTSKKVAKKSTVKPKNIPVRRKKRK